MATTQYQIFCRYLNESVNRVLTNRTDMDWIGAEEYTELTEFYTANKKEYDAIRNKIIAGEIKENQLILQEVNIYNNCKKYEDIQDKIQKKKMTIEYCILEPADSLYNDTSGIKRKAQAERDLELYEIIIEQSLASNPKYDMIFMYDGIAYTESRTGEADYNPPSSNKKQVPYVYYERMKRVRLDPWFLFSTHASLNSAMLKARELVNILGKDAVKIGKVVPLDQYIEIV